MTATETTKMTKTNAEYLAEDIAELEEDLAGYIAEGDAAAAKDAKELIADAKADYAVETGESSYEEAAKKYGAPALNNEGIHSDPRLA